MDGQKLDIKQVYKTVYMAVHPHGIENGTEHRYFSRQKLQYCEGATFQRLL